MNKTLHHFSVRALPIWNGLKAWSAGFQKQKQINRGDPREILLWYLGLQPGNAPISLYVTCNTGFFFLVWMDAHFSLASCWPLQFLVVYHKPEAVCHLLSKDVLNFSTTAPWHTVLLVVCCLKHLHLHLNWLHATMIYFLEWVTEFCQQLCL